MRKRQEYPYETKKQAVKMYFEGHGVPAVVAHFGITERSSVYNWINHVKARGYEGLEDQRGLHRREGGTTRLSSLEEENQKLRLENHYLKKVLELRRG